MIYLSTYLLTVLQTELSVLLPKQFSAVSQADWLVHKSELIIVFFPQRMWAVGCRRLKALFGRYPDVEVYSFLHLICQAMLFVRPFYIWWYRLYFFPCYSTHNITIIIYKKSLYTLYFQWFSVLYVMSSSVICEFISCCFVFFYIMKKDQLYKRLK